MSFISLILYATSGKGNIEKNVVMHIHVFFYGDTTFRWKKNGEENTVQEEFGN